MTVPVGTVNNDPTQGATQPVQGIFGGATSSASSTGSTGGMADKDMFLQLLVAQMKYQDPMNPTDSSQFLAQSAQFTALEKMQAVADQTQALLVAQTAFGASGLIGKAVTWTDSDGTTRSGTVAGVTFGAQGPVLDVGAKDPLPISSVLSVTDAGSAGSTSSSAAGA
jgi:flagellar basal-body rod modification protein FlgD